MTTTTEKVARRKLSLLELASNLDNVSRACKLMGYSRQQFYEIRRNFQTFGADGLIDRLPGARGPHPNRVPVATEQAWWEADHVHASRLTEKPLVDLGFNVAGCAAKSGMPRNEFPEPKPAKRSRRRGKSAPVQLSFAF